MKYKKTVQSKQQSNPISEKMLNDKTQKVMIKQRNDKIQN